MALGRVFGLCFWLGCLFTASLNAAAQDHGYLGVIFYQPRYPTDTVRVMGTDPSSPAEYIELQNGDQILKADGETLHGYLHLTKIIEEKQPGDVLTLEVRRGELIGSLKVLLSSRQEVKLKQKRAWSQHWRWCEAHYTAAPTRPNGWQPDRRPVFQRDQPNYGD